MQGRSPDGGCHAASSGPRPLLRPASSFAAPFPRRSAAAEEEEDDDDVSVEYADTERANLRADAAGTPSAPGSRAALITADASTRGPRRGVASRRCAEALDQLPQLSRSSLAAYADAAAVDAADRQTAVAADLESGGLETLCSLYEEAEDLEDEDSMRRAFAVLRAALLSCREPLWRACTQDAFFPNVLGMLDRAWPARLCRKRRQRGTRANLTRRDGPALTAVQTTRITRKCLGLRSLAARDWRSGRPWRCLTET